MPNSNSNLLEPLLSPPEKVFSHENLHLYVAEPKVLVLGDESKNFVSVSPGVIRMALISSCGKRVGLANPNDVLFPTKPKNLNKHYVSLLVVGGSDAAD